MSYVNTEKIIVEHEGTRWDKSTTLKKGSKYKNLFGVEVEISKHLGKSEYECILDGFKLKYEGAQLKTGKFRTPLDKRIYKTGFIGFGEYTPSKDKIAYRKWQGLFKRCYSGLDHYRSYRDTKVCEEWHNFQNFCKWFYCNYEDGLELDKDLKAYNFSGKLYSPDFCTFLPKKLNVLVTKINHQAVTKERLKYRAKLTLEGKGVELGRFDSKLNALWIKRAAKIGYIEQRLRSFGLENLIGGLDYEL